MLTAGTTSRRAGVPIDESIDRNGPLYRGPILMSTICCIEFEIDVSRMSGPIRTRTPKSWSRVPLHEQDPIDLIRRERIWLICPDTS